jgi:hypothetical protein
MMPNVAKADPGARRKAVYIILVCTLIGAALIVSFERYRRQLHDWILADPSGHRMQLVLLSLAFLGSVPLVGFAVYLWSLGSRTVQAQQFPPPGQRVLRDTPVVTGQAALVRGRLVKTLAISLFLAAALLSILFWRLASVVAARAA